MIIYNVTTTISESIHDQWVTWMQEQHIPEVLATGKFTSARLVKVLVGKENDEITYAVQYTTDSKEKLDKYYKEDAPRLQNEAIRLFADKLFSFRTELEHISEHYSMASAQ
jgi:hypothetical protein